MIVYSSTITTRLRYICDFVGNEIIGQPFTLTDNLQEFKTTNSPRMNYSSERIRVTDLWLRPHSLLFERNIQDQKPECIEEGEYKTFFKTTGDIEFDIFAAVFYLISRYEEYLPHKKDEYGRYGYENSLAYKENFLRIPLVNIWLNHFRERLRNRFPSLAIREPVFSFVPTYDIDEAYSFRDKQWWRTIGGMVKDLVKGKTGRIGDRSRVIRKKQGDPFDSYSWMDVLHEKNVLHPHYFFLVAEKNGKYDKNILPSEDSMKELIKTHAEKYSIGLHPSWQSFEKPELVKSEIKQLEKISGQKIISSRQHFIKMDIPETYRNLIKAGIIKDFSLGYGSINGFRASVASPFYWYDLEKEQITSLLIHPFCFMDANCYFEQKQSPAEAFDELCYYYSEIKKQEATFIMIWHNTFLGTDPMFAGWREIYKRFIEEISD